MFCLNSWKPLGGSAWRLLKKTISLWFVLAAAPLLVRIQWLKRLLLIWVWLQCFPFEKIIIISRRYQGCSHLLCSTVCSSLFVHVLQHNLPCPNKIWKRLKKKKKGVGFFANLSIRSLLIKLSRHPLTGNYVLSLNPLIYPHHFSVRIFFTCYSMIHKERRCLFSNLWIRCTADRIL